jgi:hypothetical protein
VEVIVAYFRHNLRNEYEGNEEENEMNSLV